ncbi:Unannotated [Lentimonas sp. CC4]|nr:Unannotated [Lentimonas sp. CC4]CAA6686541.1 Unannotated [Lentimonas sp. CC6]CAA7074817.1 Unannotated [Lentimonas sp. CC4]CAA7169444.1 Unannotated [Lentimonas sp. CC21]CAA7180165.1 Unannotated [Lentimonas sp. CC8]
MIGIVKDIQSHLQGKSLMVRYADDFVMGFANKGEAESILEALKERFAAYGLQNHPEKTRLVQRKTSAKRFRCSLKSIKEWGWKHRHLSLKEQQEQINRKLSGHRLLWDNREHPKPKAFA